jgi:hypothetical protein
MKKFFFGMTVLLSASLVLIGCPTDTEEKTVTVTEMVHLDEFAANGTALIAALATPGNRSIGLAASVTLSANLTIPAGKLVYILNEGSLATSGSYTLTVEGQVYVGVDGTLTATADAPVEVTTGKVHVVKGGTLSIDTALAVTDGADPAKPALGSVGFAAEATLAITGTLNDAAAIKAVWDLLPRGEFDLSGATLTSAKVSELAALPGISETKRITATATADEDETDPFTIPKGADITAKSADTLANITGLTVNGSFTTAAGTLAKVTALTVGEDGELDVSTAGTLAALTDLVVNGELTVGDSVAVSATLASGKVSGTGRLTLGDTDISAATYTALLNIRSVRSAATTLSAAFTVPEATTLTLTAAAAPAENVTVNGTVFVANSASLTIKEGKTLANAGTVGLMGTSSLVLKTADTSAVAKITGTGSLTAGATTITGAWEAVAGTASAGTVTIASGADGATITADGTNATGLKASASGATITQMAFLSHKLTIATGTTINLSAAGSIVLKKPTTLVSNDGATINLDTTTAKIAGFTGGSSNRTLSDTAIANATYTVGSSTGHVSGGGTSGAGNAHIAGGNDTGPNPIKAANNAAADVIINKDITVGS